MFKGFTIILLFFLQVFSYSLPPIKSRQWGLPAGQAGIIAIISSILFRPGFSR